MGNKRTTHSHRPRSLEPAVHPMSESHMYEGSTATMAHQRGTSGDPDILLSPQNWCAFSQHLHVGGWVQIGHLLGGIVRLPWAAFLQDQWVFRWMSMKQWISQMTQKYVGMSRHTVLHMPRTWCGLRQVTLKLTKINQTDWKLLHLLLFYCLLYVLPTSDEYKFEKKKV